MGLKVDLTAATGTSSSLPTAGTRLGIVSPPRRLPLRGLGLRKMPDQVVTNLEKE
jgi:hypothetical protein